MVSSRKASFPMSSFLFEIDFLLLCGWKCLDELIYLYLSINTYTIYYSLKA